MYMCAYIYTCTCIYMCKVGPKIVTAPTRPPNLKSAITQIQILIYYSTLVQTNVSLLQSFRDQSGCEGESRW